LEGITDSMRYSLAPFNIAVTNINAGPVKTNITNAFDASKFRQVDDKTQYLSFLTQSALENINRYLYAVFIDTHCIPQGFCVLY
jgi:NAD(P)-dependent dehydrogenase (short-subunit alcohol dehydrogenase family)